MTIIESLAPFIGSWQGHNLLRIMPTDDYQESVSAATVTVTAGAFVTIEYTWQHEGKPQSGLLLLGSGPAAGEAPEEGSAAPEEEDAAAVSDVGDGAPAEGTAGTQGAKAVWVDSFHSGPEWLTLDGNIDDDGVIRLTGWYPAPSGPDWGWQIHVHPGDGNGGRITMHNMVPGHDPYQVVDATYRRQA
ncbi:DUF1579 family protein [Arthrobacter sp. Y81]|uniref:DUF1579 family protein n=1 Tax=Arthrobacter sp. Y81 TaxID=2058897 RepID=UPI000CE4150E|nr:DUF1579 family protein [Arthrobacter sp. Y81]